VMEFWSTGVLRTVRIAPRGPPGWRLTVQVQNIGNTLGSIHR